MGGAAQSGTREMVRPAVLVPTPAMSRVQDLASQEALCSLA